MGNRRGTHLCFGFSFFSSYLEGICTILYDALRPYIIHINHLETLAEICSILRVEMLDEHVQHNGKVHSSISIARESLIVFICSRITGSVWQNMPSIAAGCARASRVPRPSLFAIGHPELQTVGGRFGVSGQTGDDAKYCELFERIVIPQQRIDRLAEHRIGQRAEANAQK